MAHKRLRPCSNTKETYPEQKLDNDLSQGVVARGTMVFLRRQVSQDLDSRESLHVGDAGAQTAEAMANIKLLLEEAGSEMGHICQIVVYLSNCPLSRGGLSGDGQMDEGGVPLLHRPRRACARPSGMGGRDRSHRRHPRSLLSGHGAIGLLHFSALQPDRNVRHRRLLLQPVRRGALRACPRRRRRDRHPEHHRSDARPRAASTCSPRDCRQAR